MQELAVQWYAILGTLNAAVTDPLRGLSDSLGLPLVSALLFGLMGATSPCQLCCVETRPRELHADR